MATAADRLEDELVRRPDAAVVVAGVGVSLATCGGDPRASWAGLLRHGLRACRDECGTDPGVLAAHQALLDIPAAPVHALIGVGEFITAELRAQHPGRYARWLADALGGLEVKDPRAVRAIERLGARVATTNYDGLIEAASAGLKTPLTWRQKAAVTAYFRERGPAVLHLHGHVSDSDSVVLGATSYEQVCRDPGLQDALRLHFRFGTLVFVGCGRGLYDPNFGTLLRWARTALADVQHEHFVLVTDPEVAGWTADLKGLPFRPVGYGPDHASLVPFLEDLGRRVGARRDPRALPTLVASQTAFDARWEEAVAARDGLSPADYLRRLRALARALAEAGGLHRAAMAFGGAVRHGADGLTAGECVEFALDAAEWLLADDLPDLAAHHLDRAERQVGGGGVPPDLCARFRRLRVRVMDALSAYPETLQAITDQLAAAPPEDRDRLEAERAEIRLLQGDFDQVAREDWP